MSNETEDLLVDANTVNKALESMGIAMVNTANTNRTLADILKDVSHRFEKQFNIDVEKRKEKEKELDEMRASGKSVSVMVFDQTNKQRNYQYVGETYSGDTVVGSVVYDEGIYIYDPRYYIYTSASLNTSVGGEVNDHNMRRVEVRPDTIRPYTQIERIKEELRKGNCVELVRNLSDSFSDKSICTIASEKEIPYKLWFGKTTKTKRFGGK